MKPKEIQIPNFNNNIELVRFILDIVNGQNIELEKINKSIVESMDKNLARETIFFNLLCKELDVDFEKLQKEAETFLDEHWENIKKQVQGQSDVEKCINEIFKGKEL